MIELWAAFPEATPPLPAVAEVWLASWPAARTVRAPVRVLSVESSPSVAEVATCEVAVAVAPPPETMPAAPPVPVADWPVWLLASTLTAPSGRDTLSPIAAATVPSAVAVPVAAAAAPPTAPLPETASAVAELAGVELELEEGRSCWASTDRPAATGIVKTADLFTVALMFGLFRAVAVERPIAAAPAATETPVVLALEDGVTVAPKVTPPGAEMLSSLPIVAATLRGSWCRSRSCRPRRRSSSGRRPGWKRSRSAFPSPGC